MLHPAHAVVGSPAHDHLAVDNLGIVDAGQDTIGTDGTIWNAEESWKATGTEPMSLAIRAKVLLNAGILSGSEGNFAQSHIDTGAPFPRVNAVNRPPNAICF
jgi:hypothetical protein